MRAIILAGGLGTRLRERVEDLPKPMAPVAGRPFLEFLLERLPIKDISAITLSVGYKWESIRQYFGESFNGIPLQYAVETEPLGTGGAIVHALANHDDSPVIVLNGDTLLDLDLRAFIQWYQAKPVPVAMVVRPVPDVTRYGSLTITEGVVTAFHEKGQTGSGLINAGIYCLQPTIFTARPDGERFSFENDILQKRNNDLKIKAWLSTDYFIDIGIPEDYDRAQIELPTLRVVEHSS